VTLVATGKYIGEGFDEPRLDTLFLTMPISWKGTLQQYAGRLHRLCEQKNEVQIYDYVDIHVKMLEKMYGRRLTGYAAIDQRIAWYGSINLLSYGEAEESIMRLESQVIAGELLKIMER